MPSELEWAWAAGIFEGEGCFAAYGTRRQRLTMRVAMTDLDVLTRYALIVGGHVTGPYKYDEIRKPHYVCAINGDVALEALSHFWSWLGERRLERFYDLKVNSLPMNWVRTYNSEHPSISDLPQKGLAHLFAAIREARAAREP